MSPLDHGEALEAYVADHTTPPAPHLEELERETRAELESPGMLTGRVEGRLLETLVHAIQPRLVLELGTYSGYSALSMAAALPEGGRIVSCELSAERADFAQRHIDASPYADRIEIRRGPALDTVATLDGPFDLVFIDADKEGYVGYYDAVVPKLAPHGLIVADNTLWSGRVADPSDDGDTTRAVREFNDHVRDDPRTVCVMLTVRDGITLIRLA
ncbi:MAG: caffeoyl-CoA O-methyltransferase [Solirubrobacteraceae bacterium]|nr:caffeoyl-CoA O-methyltransferase [Solirubrobacteraceae bacterium]